MRVVIIGAGFGGLAAAALLAQENHQVTVLERLDHAGGRATVLKKKGFLFDKGPSWYLMPDVFENFFAKFNKRPSDFYKLKRLDPSYRIFFSKEDVVDLSADLKKNEELFEKIEPGSKKKLRDYMRRSSYKYEVSMKRFLYKSYRSLFDFFNWEIARGGLRLKVFQNFDKYTRGFFRSDRLNKILQYTIVFLGGNPKNTPALYSLMTHVDFKLGVWYPKGGMGEVVKGIQALAESKGAEFLFNEDVTGIVVRNGKVKAVKTRTGMIDADLVVVNADYAHAEMKLLPNKYQTYNKSYWKKATMAPSAFILYLGLNKKLKSLTHHNLFFADDWTEHFDQIFNNPAWPKTPSYYVCCPSKTDAAVAPKGKENLFILVPVASGLKDTEKIREIYARKVIEDLEDTIGEKIEKHIVVKETFAHKDFAKDYNAWKGSALGLSHTLFQSAVFRPKHESRKVKGLYFTGQYTHPGIGVPMALISSQIVADLIEKKYGRC